MSAVAAGDDRPTEGERRKLLFWERRTFRIPRRCQLCATSLFEWRDIKDQVWHMCRVCDVDVPRPPKGATG